MECPGEYSVCFHTRDWVLIEVSHVLNVAIEGMEVLSNMYFLCIFVYEK